MLKSDQTNEIATALAKAQAAIKPPQKSKTAKVRMRDGGEYSFNYCDLADLIEAVRGPLTANDISYSFTTSHEAGVSFLDTHLLHSSGQFIGSRYPIHLNGNAQANGSELTYAKRYSLSGLVGIAAEDDDDGNAASGNDARISDRAGRQTQPRQERGPTPDRAPEAAKRQPAKRGPKASAEQVREMRSLLSVVRLPDGTVDKWMAKAGVESWDAFPAAEMTKVIEYVKARMPQVAAV